MSTPNKEETRIEYQKRVLFFGVWQSCLNCKFWQANVPNASPGIINRCMKFNVLPPLDIIVTSCPEWIPSVPF